MRHLLLWLLTALLAGCATLEDGGIVGTGNRPDCEAGKQKEECKPERASR